MKKNPRRNFLKKSVIATGSLLPLSQMSFATPSADLTQDPINFIGPRKGFTPKVGTLVSMMNFMRSIILRPIQGLSTKDLDFLLDEKANSIGAMLLHLAAVERYYQEDTFDGKTWDLPAKENHLWEAASDLGDKGRAEIKGYPLDFYLKVLEESRAFSIAEMKKRDDEWLTSELQFWGSTSNNYCKWFHVVEHESNHNGQIKMVKSRIG